MLALSGHDDDARVAGLALPMLALPALALVGDEGEQLPANRVV